MGIATRVCRNSTKIVSIVIAAIISILPSQVLAAESAGPLFSSPFGYKQYHVHYDVNADGAIKELGDLTMTVLSEQGVLASRQMPFGMQNMSMYSGSSEVEILAAYTLKKNGERIDAIVMNPPAMTPRFGVAPPPGAPQIQMKSVVFQRAAVGDLLVVSYQAIQKKPTSPNGIVLDIAFPKFLAFDDAIISMSAPASLNLRVEAVGVEKGTSTIDGPLQEWEWKYQNRTPLAPQANQPMSFARLHISSFKDHAAEKEAFNQLITQFRQATTERLGCGTFPANTNDGPSASDEVANLVADYFWNSEYFLEKLVSAWNSPTCVFDDGRPKLAALRFGYTQAFKNGGDWSKSLARINDLKRKFPNKAFVAFAEARYWIDYAWDARGTGYASSVTQDGWKLFRDRLEKAERVLLEAKPYASDFPNWNDEMIVVQSALGRPAQDRGQAFVDGATRFKTFYPTYFTMLNFISPSWGGSWEAVDGLVKWSVENTKEADGNSMYTRLYWAASQSYGVNLFKDTHASWPKMRKGFEDMMAQHPKSKWNLNNFAMFACQAGDKKTFRMLRRKIGKDVMEDAWSENVSLDLCETKFAYAK